MIHQPDDIRKYVTLTETSRVQLEESTTLLDVEVPDLDIETNQLNQDLQDMIFKFRSYSEVDGSPDYAQGVEEGLALAANMLERLLAQYSSDSSN